MPKATISTMLTTGHSNPRLQTSTLWFRYLCEAIERAGLDVKLLASEIGLDLQSLEDPGGFLEDEFTALLLIAAENKSGDPGFGLKAGQYFVPSAFGPLGYSMMTSTTLLDALQRTVQFTSTVTEGTKVRLVCDDNTGFLEISMPSYHLEVARLVDDFMMTCILSAFRWLLGRHFNPLRVDFMHAEPQSTLNYVQVFGHKPVFSTPRCGFLFSRVQLDSRVIFADAAMADIHDQYAASKLSYPISTPLVPHLLRIIRQKLHHGEPTLALVAEQLNVSERTLQRRLKQENQSFHELVDVARRKLLELLLADNSLPFKEVANQLGFADQSSFTRAVHRWYGQSPKGLRLARKACEYPEDEQGVSARPE
jgi:AraC-like DNA-binding protein